MRSCACPGIGPAYGIDRETQKGGIGGLAASARRLPGLCEHRQMPGFACSGHSVRSHRAPGCCLAGGGVGAFNLCDTEWLLNKNILVVDQSLRIVGICSVFRVAEAHFRGLRSVFRTMRSLRPRRCRAIRAQPGSAQLRRDSLCVAGGFVLTAILNARKGFGLRGRRQRQARLGARATGQA